MGRTVKCLDCGYVDGRFCLLDGAGKPLPNGGQAVFVEFGPGEVQTNSLGIPYSPQAFNPVVSRTVTIPTDTKVSYRMQTRISTGENFGLPCHFAKAVWLVSWDGESYEVDHGERATDGGTYAIDCNTLEAVLIDGFWDRLVSAADKAGA